MAKTCCGVVVAGTRSAPSTPKSIQPELTLSTISSYGCVPPAGKPNCSRVEAQCSRGTDCAVTGRPTTSATAEGELCGRVGRAELDECDSRCWQIGKQPGGERADVAAGDRRNGTVDGS